MKNANCTDCAKNCVKNAKWSIARLIGALRNTNRKSKAILFLRNIKNILETYPCEVSGMLCERITFVIRSMEPYYYNEGGKANELKNSDKLILSTITHEIEVSMGLNETKK